MQNSFIVYESWSELLSALPKEDAGELIQAMCRHSRGEAYKITNDWVRRCFEMLIRPGMDRSRERYLEKIMENQQDDPE